MNYRTKHTLCSIFGFQPRPRRVEPPPPSQDDSETSQDVMRLGKRWRIDLPGSSREDDISMPLVVRAATKGEARAKAKKHLGLPRLPEGVRILEEA